MAPATLKPGGAMTIAREGQAAVRLVDGRILVIGGTVPFIGTCPMACVPPETASVEIYNPSTGKFSPNGSLVVPRTNGQALPLNDGRVLVSGGWIDYGNSSSLEIYDPARGTSVAVKLPADIQKPPSDATLVLLADGRVLIAGGSYDDGNSTSNETLIFDPASGAFSDGPLMAESRQGATGTLLADGRVLIAGGDHFQGYNDYMNNNVELIDPSHPLLQATLVGVQYSPGSSTLLSDGRVLLVERGPYGTVGRCMTPGGSEVFDPRTGKLTQGGPMSTPRSGSTAVKINDGRVLFFGGLDVSCAAVGTVEAFDPDSGTFQVIATGFPKISNFSATLLEDGGILIAGGSDGVWNGMTAASWLLKA